jgi:uncharacterized protein DUF1963
MASTPAFLTRVPERIREVLVRASPEVLSRAEAFLAGSARPCVYFDSKRVDDLPLRRGLIGGLLNKPVAAPQLPLLQSKFGGTPYLTEPDLPLMKGRRFLLQINLAEVPDLPAPFPRAGMFCVDMVDRAPYWRWFGVRFYPDASESLAVQPATPVRCVGRNEAAVRFMPGMSYPADEWERIFGDQDDELKDAWSDCEYEMDKVIGGRSDTNRGEPHRLGGHRTWMLEHSVFRPPEGYSKHIREYELLLRLPFDNEAGFAWGSNVAYVVIHRDDLAAGRLGRAFDVPANA